MSDEEAPLGFVEWQETERNWPSTFAAGAFPARVHRPARPRELRGLVRVTLTDLLGYEPRQYEQGKFWFDDDGLGFAVMTDKKSFPWIRVHHPVIEDVATDERVGIVDFINSLSGRSSTNGVHWWLGNATLWQAMEIRAAKFDEEIFLDHLETFIAIAHDRTPELRVRFTGSADGIALAPFIPLMDFIANVDDPAVEEDPEGQ